MKAYFVFCSLFIPDDFLDFLQLFIEFDLFMLLFLEFRIFLFLGFRREDMGEGVMKPVMRLVGFGVMELENR